MEDLINSIEKGLKNLANIITDEPRLIESKPVEIKPEEPRQEQSIEPKIETKEHLKEPSIERKLTSIQLSIEFKELLKLKKRLKAYEEYLRTIL